MASQLLKCSVCPKSTSFSDVSHLLTHVGSKAHLSNLHKLEIRSQQQISAGQRLAAYNQWFQEHGIAQLLSERLQQKEAKQAAKVAGNKRRARAAKTSQEENDSAYSNSQPYELESSVDLSLDITKYEMLPAAVEQDVKEYMYTPVRQPSRLKIRSPMSPPCHFLEQLSDDEYPTEIDPQLTASPTTPKLKGIVWPGMALFDAADEDTKRKRNQRKDGSVLKKMERSSTLVHPYETVHSANGVALKERHMEELENGSLVEGESPLMRPSPKRRTRRANRTPSSSPPKPKKARTRTKNKKHRSPPVRQRHKTRSSTNSLRTCSTQPEALINGPIKIPQTLHDPGYSKKNHSFAVYEDHPLKVDTNNASESLPNPFLDPDGEHQPDPTSQLAYNSVPWLKVESQQVQAYSPFSAYQSVQSEPTKNSNSPTSRPRMPLTHKSANIPLQRSLNPLFWKKDVSPDPVSELAIPPNLLSDPFGDFQPNLSSQLYGSYAYSRNPLVGALAHIGQDAGFAGHKENMRELHSNMNPQHHLLTVFSP